MKPLNIEYRQTHSNPGSLSFFFLLIIQQSLPQNDFQWIQMQVINKQEGGEVGAEGISLKDAYR